MTVGERIAQRRKELGLSLKDVADKLGKNPPAIYKYEHDMVDMPASAIKGLHNVLGISYLDLLTDEDDDMEIIAAYHRATADRQDLVRDILKLPETKKDTEKETG